MYGSPNTLEHICIDYIIQDITSNPRKVVWDGLRPILPLNEWCMDAIERHLYKHYKKLHWDILSDLEYNGHTRIGIFAYAVARAAWKIHRRNNRNKKWTDYLDRMMHHTWFSFESGGYNSDYPDEPELIRCLRCKSRRLGDYTCICRREDD